MNEIKDIVGAMPRTGDGKSALFWTLVFIILLIRSIAHDGFILDDLKYIFLSLFPFLIFTRFREETNPGTSMWGLININGFCLYIIYIEFFK